VGDALTSGPPADAYPYTSVPFSALNIAGPHAAFGEIVAFTLTGFGDVASLTGYCAIAPAVPLPGTLLFLGSGLLGLVGVGLRRKN
jgi:hypothetical protein